MREEGPLSDPRAAAEARRIERRRARIIAQAVISLSNDKDFVLWVSELVEARCGLRTVLVGASDNDLRFNEGRRSIGSEVLAQFERHAPGFHERLLTARRNLESEIGIKRDEPAEEKDDERTDQD